MTTGRLTARRATFVYVFAAPAMSWPLLLRIDRAMPGDLGDSLLNAWIRSAGVTHVVLHGAAYPDGRDEPVMDWLRGRGGRAVATFGTDELVMLPR